MTPGLVLLSQNDTDAPTDLPAMASVSKTEEWDDGGRSLGVAAAAAGKLWTDRPYATGNPSVDWMAERIRGLEADGCAAVQVCNELNLPLEGWQGGPEAYAAYYRQLVGLFPGMTLLYQPPSPGVAGWEEWVDPAAPACAVHAYGTKDQMQSVVAWYLLNTAAELWITECNFGAGNSVDPAAWARDELDPFLAWCAGQPRVRAALYFSWRWNEAAGLPTSTDAAACPAIVDVLRAAPADAVVPPPVEGGGSDEDNPAELEALWDQVWILAEQAEAMGQVWYGQALKSATALAKGEP